MKNLITIFFAILALQISAQDFAPIGALWHYDEGTANSELISYETIESIADTMISTVSCRKLIKTSRYGLTPVLSDIFMYSRNDSVFFLADNEFHLLYDFSADKGDTIILGYYTNHDGTALKMIIDSTSEISINGQIRKLQYVTSGDGISIEFGGIVISGIGNIEYMFPHYDMWNEGPLRCYEDSICGLFKNSRHTNNGWNFQDCDQIITGINEAGLANGVSLYPNPTTSLLNISNLDQKTEYVIIECYGRSLKGGFLLPSETINIEDLPDGIYSILLINNKIKTITRRIIKL